MAVTSTKRTIDTFPDRTGTPNGVSNEKFSFLQNIQSSVIDFLRKREESTPKTSPPALSVKDLLYNAHPLFNTRALTALIGSYLLGTPSKFALDQILDYDPAIILKISLSERRSFTIREASYFKEESAFKHMSYAEILRNSPNLRHVDLSYFSCIKINKIKGDALFAIEDLSSHVQSIKFGNISDSCLSAYAARYPSLSSIDLPNQKAKFITDKKIIALARNCPQLTSIKTGFTLSDAALEALGVYCKNLSSVMVESPLSIASIIKLAGCCSLTTVSLRQPCSNGELKALAKQCPELTLIDLSWNDSLTDTGLEYLAQHCPFIRTINLTGCHKISDRGIELLTKMFPQMTSINLSHCIQISDVGIKAIEACGPSLISLNLSFCQKISSAVFSSLFTQLPNLSTAILSYTSITDKEVKIMAKKCSYMTSIDLEGCAGITRKGLKALAESCLRLEQVRVSNRKLSKSCLKTLESQYSVFFHFGKVSVLTRDM